MESSEVKDTADTSTTLSISALNRSPGIIMQPAAKSKSIDKLNAFIFHSSSSLKESIFMWHNEEETLTATVSISGGYADLAVREIVGEGDGVQKKASDYLRTFCQVIDVQPRFAGAPIFAAGTILQVLMQFVSETPQDGELQAAQPNEQLPYGIERLWRLSGRPLQKKLEKLIEEGEDLGHSGAWMLHKISLPGSSKMLIDFHPLREHGGLSDYDAWHWSLCLNIAAPKFLEQFRSDGFLHLQTFQQCCVLGFQWYAQARAFVRQPERHLEAAKLIEKCGRLRYLNNSRSVSEEEVIVTYASRKQLKDETEDEEEDADLRPCETMTTQLKAQAKSSLETGCYKMPGTPSAAPQECSAARSFSEDAAVVVISGFETEASFVDHLNTKPRGREKNKKTKGSRKNKKKYQATEISERARPSQGSGIIGNGDSQPPKDCPANVQKKATDDVLKTTTLASKPAHSDSTFQMSAAQPSTSLLHSLPEDQQMFTMSDESSTTSSTISASELAARPFRFDDLDPRTRCRLPDCRKMTSCYDGESRWCPGCGHKSFVRYCSKAHLYRDIKRHHASECCLLAIPGLVDESTILASQAPPRLYIGFGIFYHDKPTSHLGSVERHRQAVYYAMETCGEYFLFNDRSLLPPSDYLVTPDNLQAVRGLGSPVHCVEIHEHNYTDTRRARFRQDLRQVLTRGTRTPALEKAATRVLAAIRLSLINSKAWNAFTIDLLCLQVAFEFGWQIPEEMTKEETK